VVGAPKNRMEEVIREIKKLDKPPSPQMGLKPIPLVRQGATHVATLITSFWNQRYPGETSAQHQIRVIADDPSNSVLVQASPGDFKDIEDLIKWIDTETSRAVNQLRVVPIRYATSDELATLIQRALSEGVVAPGTGTQAAPTGGALGAGGGALGGA